LEENADEKVKELMGDDLRKLKPRSYKTVLSGQNGIRRGGKRDSTDWRGGQEKV